MISNVFMLSLLKSDSLISVSLGASRSSCQIWLEYNPLSTYLHIKPNLPLTLVNGGCYGYTPFLEELHNLLTVSGYLEWQENPASKGEAGRGGASHSVQCLVFHPGLCDISHICMARWCLWRVGIDCWDSLLRSAPQGCRPSDCSAMANSSTAFSPFLLHHLFV